MATLIPRCVHRPAYDLARSVCRQQILKEGLCEIPGFLKPDHVASLLSAAERLKGRAHLGFRSFERHNVYLEEPPVDAAAGGGGGRSGNADRSTLRSASFSSSKVLINQREIADDCPQLLELFQWSGLRELLQIAFGLPQLYPSSDAVGGVYLNFFERGDKLGWHFDRSEYSVNLILRECPSSASRCEEDVRGAGKSTGWGSAAPRPGAFMYFPDSRGFFDSRSDYDLSRLDAWAPQDEARDPELRLVAPDLRPGTLYLFAGNRSLHCVSENTTDVSRVNAIFTFNTQPNVELNAYTRQKFFGC